MENYLRIARAYFFGFMAIMATTMVLTADVRAASEADNVVVLAQLEPLPQGAVVYEPRRPASRVATLSPDFDVITFGLLGVLTLFLITVDFALNEFIGPLPKTKRWYGIGTAGGVALGIGYALLYSSYHPSPEDAQLIADITYHPIASGVGALLPITVLSTAFLYFYHRKNKVFICSLPGNN